MAFNVPTGAVEATFAAEVGAFTVGEWAVLGVAGLAIFAGVRLAAGNLFKK